MTEYLNGPDETIRSPRWRVLANGQPLEDVEAVSVASQNNYSADRFHGTLIVQTTSKFGVAWWASQTEHGVEIEIQSGFIAPGDDQAGPPTAGSPPTWKVIFGGTVDGYSYHPERSIIEVLGRDFSSRLIDAKTREAFANKTASEVAMILAKRHGLVGNIQTTDTPIGVYYQGEHDKLIMDSLHSETSEWSLLVRLARLEGFDLWMTGKTLNFRAATPNDQPPYLVTVQIDPTTGILTSNVDDLRLDHDFNKSKDIRVTVKTWNSKQKTSHEYSAGGSGKKGAAPVAFVYIIPGLSPADAQKRANEILAMLTKLEKRISYSEPGSLRYGPRDNVKLVGTNSAFDGAYFVDSMDRQFGLTTGFRQSVTLKNHSTRGQDSGGQ